MPDWRVVPIQDWPTELTEERKESRFRAAWAISRTGNMSTLELLDRELRFLEAENLLLQMAVTPGDIRRDGKIRANATPSHPGVILTFDSKFGPISYPCDAFWDWRDNVRAIALSLEALRRVDRYGVSKRGEQYTGWKRLAARVDGGPHAVLALHARLSEAEVRKDPRRAYLLASKATHPDRGGEAKDFALVGEAARILGVSNG